ncbi:peptidoglycan-associated lipoprotein Pal [Serratia marcescens]|uniref:peptidoglycan-associated lipoprotein Pal n=1 Tax=Serratia marcescens TaxID=615 RepID=UPI00137721B2|nr:peptidoglycan-associated lipoprotein Pal [Serratia marcescens]NCI84826.1 peptidoglycan-associated lipoprotein Pal [Serratia marcescens]NDI95893.1 peptidoglycan-associated lipoprotein Pal [Serratia marcescens]NDJ65010.1 peptidoglycan-associated lipoprotein Pal [Serratia marcescens]HAT3781502.1 peptidoglycan-associated lipoprotein Pal [Serratia marcescens]HAT3850617.1 peptidoglycan-associated lipoprotein Pal [Serratia marcescens]
MNKFGKVLLTGMFIYFLAGCSNNKEVDNDDIDFTAPVYNIQPDTGRDSAEILTLRNLQDNNVIHFGFDKFQVSPENEEVLDEHAEYLLQHPNYTVTIEGHADERGSSEYNIALGERRARAVEVYLRSKGVLSQQIVIVSFGKEKPAAFGHTPEVYAKNRRAVLVY